MLARQLAERRPLQGSPALVLGGPDFRRREEALPLAPPFGLLVKAVQTGGVARRAGLRPGDILLEYAGKRLARSDDLNVKEGDDHVAVRLWREGATLTGRVPSGALGVETDHRPVAEALAAWRSEERKLMTSMFGGPWKPLPGTLLEAEAVRRLIPSATLLLHSDASEQRLDQLVLQR